MDALFDLIDFLLRDPATILLALAGAGAMGALALAGQWADRKSVV